ncbi:MAG TPA: ABC transporter ATP-binding protein [Symbiobacteriaceae bacterium]
MIELRRVSKSYPTRGGRVVALAELSTTIQPGEFVVLTGRSGAGKSTLLSLASGLLKPDTGEVRIAGRNLWDMSDGERSLLRCRTMGFVFQFASLIPTLTVLENVLLPNAFLPRGERTSRQRAEEMLERVGLPGFGHRMPWQLSGGQQKRVAVARALLLRPALIFADEPTADLDAETEQVISDLLQEEHRRGCTVMLATHNRELVGLATRHLGLAEGRLVLAS